MILIINDKKHKQREELLWVLSSLFISCAWDKRVTLFWTKVCMIWHTPPLFLSRQHPLITSKHNHWHYAKGKQSGWFSVFLRMSNAKIMSVFVFCFKSSWFSTLVLSAVLCKRVGRVRAAGIKVKFIMFFYFCVSGDNSTRLSFSSLLFSSQGDLVCSLFCSVMSPNRKRNVNVKERGKTLWFFFLYVWWKRKLVYWSRLHVLIHSLSKGK